MTEVSLHEDVNGAGRGKVTDAYSLGKVIGSGSYSVVREGVHKRSKEKFAIKCIKRSELSDEDDEAIMTEVAILQQVRAGGNGAVGKDMANG